MTHADFVTASPDAAFRVQPTVIASETKQSIDFSSVMDCRVATLLAKTASVAGPPASGWQRRRSETGGPQHARHRAATLGLNGDKPCPPPSATNGSLSNPALVAMLMVE